MLKIVKVFEIVIYGINPKFPIDLSFVLYSNLKRSSPSSSAKAASERFGSSHFGLHGHYAFGSVAKEKSGVETCSPNILLIWPKYIPNTQFSDCWSSVGNVTFYHRSGICYFRSKAYSDFAGTADQLEQAKLHKSAIKAWQGLPHETQMIWRRMARGVASHRPPFGQKNSISGYNLFVSAYHGFAQMGNEHIPELVKFEPFPIFSLDYLVCSVAGDGLLKVHFRLTICGTGEPGRHRVLGKYQLGEPGCGLNPGLMRNCLSMSVPAGECSMIEFTLPDIGRSIIRLLQ